MRLEDRLFRLSWSYLRGWIIIIVVVLVAELVGEFYAKAAGWLDPLFGVLGSFGRGAALPVVLLILVPWALGRLSDLPLRTFHGRRQTVQAFQQLEQGLSAELRPGERRGYRVVLVPWPNPGVRTLGVVTATIRDPKTDRKLAAVFLPGTPDPTKGVMRVVAADELELTDWTLNDLIRYHVTFGSASPMTARVDGDEESPSG